MKFVFDKRKICILITAVTVLLLVAWELTGAELLLGGDAEKGLVDSVNIAVSRAIGSIVSLTILVYLGYKILNPIKAPFWRSVLFCLPPICVVVNNMPIYPLITGMANVTAPWWRVLILAAECFAVGLFEETFFRGIVFVGFLNKRRETVLKRFLAIVFSSAVFGAVHLVNIFLGASPGAVILQIGYSFLIGAMCSVVLMKTSNIWICVLLHAIYNFCGALVPDCGKGTIWEPVTVTVTVIIALATLAYMVHAFFKIKKEEVDRIYQ